MHGPLPVLLPDPLRALLPGAVINLHKLWSFQRLEHFLESDVLSDSSLRDGNRVRLIGLLAKRSAVTLCYYLMETNINLHHWLVGFMKAHPIPQTSSWEDVSEDTLLRRLLSIETVPTKWSETCDPMFDCVVSTLVDPRNIAQRIMTIRTALAREFIQDLKGIDEENNILLRDLDHVLLLQSTDEE